MTQLSDLDKQVLTRIQAGFPIESRPYAALAEAIGATGPEGPAGTAAATEADVLASVEKLRADGVIRRIGAIFDSNRLGYRSTLCAVAAPPERVDEVAELINRYPNVTHNYLREDRYNIWFTLIAPSQERIEQILAEIAASTGCDDILNLPAIRLFKIKVDFDLVGGRSARSEAPPAVKPAEVEAVALTEDEKALARLLQRDLPRTEEPFAALAEGLAEWGVARDEDWVLATTRAWVESRVIRRFGAAIKHHKTGFSANAMGIWYCPPERAEEIGPIMASFKEVSHCYERPLAEKWPWNMYTMIHGRSREECVEVAERIRAATGLEPARLLYSVREFKKTSMTYFED